MSAQPRLIAAIVVIAKDAKVRKIAQARRVVYVAETRQLMAIAVAGGPSYGGGTSTRYILRTSDEPIYRVFLYAHAGAKDGKSLDSTPITLPSKEYAGSLPDQTGITLPSFTGR